MEEPQKRLTVVPPTSCGTPASNPTMRARLLPGGLGIRATEDHVLEQGGIDRVALEQAGDDLRRQRVGAPPPPGPPFLAKWKGDRA